MPTTSPDKVPTGRLIVLVAIATTLLGDLVVIFLTIPHIPPPRAIGSVVRWLITAVLLYAVWRGRTWARWLTVALLSLGLLLAIPQALRTMHPLLIGIALQFATAICLLAFPPSVSAFLEYQRARYSGGDLPSTNSKPDERSPPNG